MPLVEIDRSGPVVVAEPAVHEHIGIGLARTEIPATIEVSDPGKNPSRECGQGRSIGKLQGRHARGPLRTIQHPHRSEPVGIGRRIITEVEHVIRGTQIEDLFAAVPGLADVGIVVAHIESPVHRRPDILRITEETGPGIPQVE